MRRGASRRGKHGTEPKSKPETTRGSENRLSVVREAAWDSHLTVFGSRVHELSPSHGGSLRVITIAGASKETAAVSLQDIAGDRLRGREPPAQNQSGPP